jgi:hypothetical protein
MQIFLIPIECYIPPGLQLFPRPVLPKRALLPKERQHAVVASIELTTDLQIQFLVPLPK